MEHTMCKASTLFNDVIAKFHPDISQDEKLKNLLSANIGWLNIESLIEQTMAAVGGYNFVDGEHYDFSDGTECKTGSVAPNPKKNLGITYGVKITNVQSCAGVTKGSLRAVIYNPHTESCSYFFIPSDHLDTEIALSYINGYGTTKVLSATWNSITNKINKLERYRVKDFETLAKM